MLAAASSCWSYAKDGRIAEVTASLSMNKPAELELRYDVPVSCAKLEFANSGINPVAAAAIRKDWTIVDNCARFDGASIQLNGACSTVRLRVPAVVRDIDRVYPWAHLIDKGIYAHTSAYALAPSCGPVQWQFAAPGGAVVVDGQPLGEEARVGSSNAGIAYAPLVFLGKPLRSGPGAMLHIDSGFAPPAVAFLNETMRAIRTEYAARLPGIPFPAPFIVAVPNNGGKRWRGDVANRNTMRLMLSPSPSEAEQQQLKFFLAHEIGHLLQPPSLNDVWKDETTIITEGGAEFLSWIVNAQLGWMSPSELTMKLEGSINSCLVTTANKSWTSTPSRHWARIPYQCGLAFHVIALGGTPRRSDASLALRSYYRDAGRGAQTDFAMALECHGQSKTCLPRWLPRLFRSDVSVAQVFAEHAAVSSYLRPIAHWQPEQVAMVARSALGKLMESDCDGQVSMFSDPGAARIGPVSKCTTFREGMVVVKAEGLPLFNGRAAVLALAKACGTSKSASLTLADGKEIRVRCAENFYIPAVLYSVKLSRLVEQLNVKLPSSKVSVAPTTVFT